MSRGAQVVRKLSDALGPRTQQVTVIPTPFTFSERQSVLRALQKYAEIDVFRKLEGEGHTASFVSVTRTETAADELIHQSPLRYQLETTKHNGTARTIVNTNKTPSSKDVTRPAQPDVHRASAGGSASDPGERKTFTVHVFPMPTYKHAAATRRSPLHEAWPKIRADTNMRYALKKSLPNNVAADGLSDWESGEQSADTSRAELVKDIVLGDQSVDVGTRAVHKRHRVRKAKQEMPAVTEGLLHLQQEETKS